MKHLVEDLLLSLKTTVTGIASQKYSISLMYMDLTTSTMSNGSLPPNVISPRKYLMVSLKFQTCILRYNSWDKITATRTVKPPFSVT